MKKIDLPPYSLVLAKWVDSNWSMGWHPKDTATAKLPIATTAGFVTCVTNDLLEISGSIGEDGGKLNPLSIPWISIIEIEILSVTSPVSDPEPSPAAIHPEFEPQDLPETVEDDASFNFRKLQMELRVH
jgi:hypothetical protein